MIGEVHDVASKTFTEASTKSTYAESLVGSGLHPLARSTAETTNLERSICPLSFEVSDRRANRAALQRTQRHMKKPFLNL